MYGQTKRVTSTVFAQRPAPRQARRCHAGSRTSSYSQSSKQRDWISEAIMARLPRRQFLKLAAGAFALPTATRIAGAQIYPARPINVIVPTGAGGPQDVIARVLAEHMRLTL